MKILMFKIKKTIKKISQLLTAHWWLVWLVAIWLLGLSLRWTNLESAVWAQDGYDESRDMLVADHLIHHHQWLWRGPLAAGGFNWLKNSPLYFYVVAGLWLVTGEPIRFMFYWAFLLSLLIGLGFWIGYRLQDRFTGLILALLMAVNPQLVFESRELLQPYFLPIFTSALILVWGRKKTDHRQINWVIFWTLIGLHFHYSALILLPLGLGWAAVNWWRNWQAKSVISWRDTTPFWVGLGMFLFWMMLTYRVAPFDQLYFLVDNWQSTTLQLEVKLLTVTRQISATFWRSEYPILGWLTLGWLGYFFWPRANQSLTAAKKLVIAGAISTWLTIFFHGHLAQTYLVVMIPFWLTWLALVLRQAISDHRLIGLLGLLTMAGLMHQVSREQVGHVSSPSFYQQQQAVANQILTDYQTSGVSSALASNGQNLPNLGVVMMSTAGNLPYDGWGVNGLWFILERELNQPLVTLTNYGVNTRPMVSQPKIIYLVCDHRYQPDLAISQCLERFKQVRDYLLPSEELLVQTKNYSVWRFFTTYTNSLESSYYYHYRDQD